ncbi:MAG: hypothetical protein NT157_03350 [Candidatus Micrarchaeota archaeon]|nr:hypothetical protein [Candidatus Micrarchaeota archaeon]
MVVVPMVLLFGSLFLMLSSPGLGLASFVFLILAIFLLMLVLSYFSLGIYPVALRRRGLKTIPWGVGAFARIIVGGIAVFLAAIFGLMDRKLFAASVLLLAGLLLTVAAMYFGFAGSAGAGGKLVYGLAGIAFIALLAVIYAVLVAYSSVRLVLWPYRFVSRGEPIIEGIKNTWKMTEGKAARIFVANFGIMLAIAFASFVLMIPIFILRVVETIALALVLGFPFPVVSMILQLAVSTLMTFPMIYALSALYSRISADKAMISTEKALRISTEKA